MSKHGWGQINAGAFRAQLTLDLDRAFSCLKSTPTERILIQHIRELSWNRAITAKKSSRDPFPDAVHVLIDVPSLAEATGCSRSALYRAKQELLRDGVLLESTSGLQVNKNVDSWSKHRLTPSQRDYAKSAQGIRHPGFTPLYTTSVQIAKNGNPVKWDQHTPVQISGQDGEDETDGEAKSISRETCTKAYSAHLALRSADCALAPATFDASEPFAVISKTGVRPRACEDEFSSSPELNSSLLPTTTLEPFLTLGGGSGGGGERDSNSGTGESRPDSLPALVAWVHRCFDGRINASQVEVLATGFPIEWTLEALRASSLTATDPTKILAMANSMLWRWRRAGAMTLVREESVKPQGTALVADSGGSGYMDQVRAGIERRKALRAKEADRGSQ